MQPTIKPTGKRVRVGGIELHYHEAGEGPAVIMLHGGGPGASGWSNFSRNLAHFAGNYRTILLDQPGFGQSDKPSLSGPLGETFAGIVRQFMDALGISQAHLLGNSMGGLVATKLALLHPERVGRLVLMGPGGGVSVLSPNPSEGRKMMMDYYTSPPGRDRLRQFLDTLMYDPSALPEEEFEARYQASLNAEAEQWYRTHMFVKSGGLYMEDYWRDFERVTHDTLLLWGRDDRVCPLDRGLFMLQRMPRVRLYVFARCGHWVQAEQPDLFNRLAMDFLQNG